MINVFHGIRFSKIMSIQEKFKTILANNSFEQLASYKEPTVWNSMSQDERELLGILFVKQGEHQLNQGDSGVLESFELASQVAPHSPAVFFRQALVYAAQGQNIRCLLAAAAALEKANELDPHLISAWHSWGNVLVRTGVFYDNASYFIQADEKFAEAERLTKNEGTPHTESFYWHWGVCWYHLGKHSGEAVDFFRSLEKFRLAEGEGCDIGEFHNDYGNVLVDLACLVGREELFLEAAEHYEKATQLGPDNYEGWLNLACTYQRLYDFTGTREYFHKADECFERAADLNGDDATVWLRWAEIYAHAGKASHDIERIQASFEKFKRAESLEEHSPYVLLRWGEAETLAASYTENLELLRQAESKIRFALAALPQQPEAWYVYGMCLSEFGRYFADEDYYLQAIEKFKHGLEINKDHPLLLHGMALAHFAIGELKADAQNIELAVNYCNQVADLGARIYPQFLSDWGVALMKLGEMTNDRTHIEEAAEKFEQAISGRLDSLESDDIELEWLYNYGCALDFLGDFHDEPLYYEKSIQVLAHVLKLDPDYHHARYNLALALAHLGELNSDVDCFLHAIEQFHHVVQHDHEDELAWNDYGLALLNVAALTHDSTTQSEMSRNYYEQAESKLQQSIALGSQQAFYNLACLHALTNNPQTSIHYLEKAEQCDALPPIDDVIHDEWLDALRDQPAYRLFIGRLLNKKQPDCQD